MASGDTVPRVHRPTGKFLESGSATVPAPEVESFESEFVSRKRDAHGMRHINPSFSNVFSCAADDYYDFTPAASIFEVPYPYRPSFQCLLKPIRHFCPKRRFSVCHIKLATQPNTSNNLLCYNRFLGHRNYRKFNVKQLRASTLTRTGDTFY